MPSSSTSPVPRASAVTCPSPRVATRKIPATAMTTTLFSTGAQAGGPKTPRVLRIAASIAPRP